MASLIDRHASNIVGVLSCFDRVGDDDRPRRRAVRK
jgi:hypothetical protein